MSRPILLARVRAVRLTAVAAAALASVVSSCSSQRADSPNQTPTTAPRTVATQPSASASAQPDEDDGDDGASSSAPVAGDDARTQAAAVANAAFTQFIRRDLTPEQWLAALTPYLSRNARDDYAGTDPSRGTTTRVISGPTLVPTSSAYLARFHFVADDGTWLVLLSRTTGADWKVERFVPPEQGED